MKNSKLKLASLISSLIISGCNNTNTLPILDENNDINALSTSFAFTEIDKVGANTGDSIVLPANNESGTLEGFVLSSYRKIFNEYDKNKNGVIDASELSQAPNSFKNLDKDHNNQLTFSEVSPNQQAIKQMAGNLYNFYKQMAQSIDTDHDNFISAKELASSRQIDGFKTLNYWSLTNNLMAKNPKAKGINYQQFSVFMNNMFVELAKRPTNTFKNVTSASRGNKIPVVIVQGYAEPSWYFMYGIYRDLKKNNWQSLYPVNLFPNITDIKEQAKIVASKIEEAKKEQGVNKIDYVCHSMGGLIGRYYIQNMNGANSIDHFVSISTPHYGTYIAWAGIGEASNQMRPGSDFLNQLNSVDPVFTYPNIKYTSIWTKTDEIVVPAENAILRGSSVLPDIKNVGHLLILWSDDTYKEIKQALSN
ncbi:MAG: alpha/beta hydrolase [Candidatus Sericytochromatia bacterium]|nr:alpha/beta hydrolase [Candidatus Sericytochromatia bacterium]